jgi:hypothetical protein
VTYHEARLIAEFSDHAHRFAREQKVQHAIGLVQKLSGCSIFAIDEASIRQAVERGLTPGAIAQQAVTKRRVKES